MVKCKSIKKTAFKKNSGHFYISNNLSEKEIKQIKLTNEEIKASEQFYSLRDETKYKENNEREP